MTATRNALRVVAAVLILTGIGAGAYFVHQRDSGLPRPGSTAYEETTRRFYRGLAALQVGLIDDAKTEFTRAIEAAPGEPASWANLGLAHLRLGEFDAALPAMERAATLAPASGEVAFLRGRLETSRGRRDEGIRHLRRAIDLVPANLQARVALVQEVEDAAGANADTEAQRLLEELVALRPDNAALLIERARLAAKRGDAAVLADSVSRLDRFVSTWPPEVVDQYRAVQKASETGKLADAARAVAFLRNVLARVPAFIESRALVTPSTELIADPLTRFLRLPVPSATPSPADDGLTFTAETLGGERSTPWTGLVAFSLDGEQRPAVFAADGREIRRVDGTAAVLPFPGGVAAGAPGVHALLALDWNHDFLMDLVAVGAGGVRLFVQSAGGAFTDDTARASQANGPIAVDAIGAWAADLEMDGDLDVLVGVRGRAPIALRNNGDGTWRTTQPFADVTGVSAFVWGDLDGDADPDAALIDEHGDLQIFANRQAGEFDRMPGPASRSGMAAVALGDVNADGVLDVVTLDTAGALRRASLGPTGWSQQQWTQWTAGSAGATPGGARVLLADLDNNGALDVVASMPARTALWLAGEDYAVRPLEAALKAEVVAAADVDGNGQLDLVGLGDGRPVWLSGRGSRGYHWQVIRPRAQVAAGDQRINSFGIGGEVEVRSGRLVQKQTITGSAVHVGLGAHTSIDVTRIVWPNGVPQAEFDPVADAPIVAQQRLKGSCPWVFADDGTGLKFVTDFLWRSPLGLRINAQDTAGVGQTEDWVRVGGNQLAARNGVYDVRISAELWETHYVDRVALMVVDHPSDVEVFVDERFARESPALVVHPMRAPRPVARAWDQTGRDVTDLLSLQDERYLGTFARGQYQGVAEDHFVEFELGADVSTKGLLWLVARGWVYPTDSSINVAIGQGSRVRPRALSLEAQDASGRWVVITPDLGFPAGKNKTVLIDLSPVARAGIDPVGRLRLRTNLEIYWDSLGVSTGVPAAELRTSRLDPAEADLRYRGFSETRQDRPKTPEVPEVPVYGRIANTTPRWRDLVGYYTRFGDVRELVNRVDDRYVIMNAGDEMKLSFAAPPMPARGWTRDFVLVGDGWNKDGDFNTSYSKTVLPLPEHGRDYRAASPALALEDDPVYRRHPDDWQTYHTRFVTPRLFLQGLRLDAPSRP